MHMCNKYVYKNVLARHRSDGNAIGLAKQKKTRKSTDSKNQGNSFKVQLVVKAEKSTLF